MSHPFEERLSQLKSQYANGQKQLEELRQWQRVTVGREERMMELKQEVNSLLEQMGKPLRYPRQTLTRKTGGERSGKSGDRSAEY